MTPQQMIETWMAAKEEERHAVEVRREIEDKLAEHFGIKETFEGTETQEVDGFEVKIVARMARKIDGDKLQELAAENGLTEFLGSLFRWKPEIDAKNWRNASEAITKPLLGAVTTSPSRPSFSIVKKEQ